MRSIEIVWEGKSWVVPCCDDQATSGPDYVDFVTILDSLGEEGRQVLFEIIVVNHTDEIQKIINDLAAV